MFIKICGSKKGRRNGDIERESHTLTHDTSLEQQEASNLHQINWKVMNIKANSIQVDALTQEN